MYAKIAYFLTHTHTHSINMFKCVDTKLMCCVRHVLAQFQWKYNVENTEKNRNMLTQIKYCKLTSNF